LKNKGGNSPTLSFEEETDLLFMREEEKVARDVYRTYFGCFGMLIFSNISESEQKHMDSLARMIDIYKLVDPVVDNTTGAFTNVHLEELYLDLTDPACEYPTSADAALYNGGLVEEIDIIDLQNAILRSDQDDLNQVYENLLQGSRNHLRAFVRQYEALGSPYVAQELSQEEVDDIVDQPMERGGPARKRGG
jgi:hypothetical protein